MRSRTIAHSPCLARPLPPRQEPLPTFKRANALCGPNDSILWQICNTCRKHLRAQREY